MDNSQVRAFLNSLPSEADFNAFCLDYFPDAYRTFSAGMDRTQRSSLLIERCGAEAIATAWKHAHSSQVSVRGQHIFQLATPLSPNFTGRQEILALLRQQLSEHRMVALCGLGGLGKTQTVVAYAHRHHEQYPVVLWLAGDSAAHLDHGIFALGQLGLTRFCGQVGYVDEGAWLLLERARDWRSNCIGLT